MFKQSTKPKLEITETPRIQRIGCILDTSAQGIKAVKRAIQLAKKVDASIQIFISEDYHTPLKALLDTMNQELASLHDQAKAELEKKGMQGSVEELVSTTVKEILDFFVMRSEKGKTLGRVITSRITEEEIQVMVVGTPLFKGCEDRAAETSLGRYVQTFLRDRSISANFLLVPSNEPEGKTRTEDAPLDSILGIITVDQQPASIVALLRRALSLADKKTRLKIIGVVGERVIETVARVEAPEDDPDAPPDLEAAASKLMAKMQETIDSISIADEIPCHSFKGVVKSGRTSSVIRDALDDFRPGLVLVRSVGELEENLDPIAEMVTRQVVAAGYPCLVMWD